LKIKITGTSTLCGTGGRKISAAMRQQNLVQKVMVNELGDTGNQ
jgi:hypothetical protein